MINASQQATEEDFGRETVRRRTVIVGHHVDEAAALSTAGLPCGRRVVEPAQYGLRVAAGYDVIILRAAVHLARHEVRVELGLRDEEVELALLPPHLQQNTHPH